MSKQSGRPNAQKHGAYSRTVLLWGEAYEDYEALRAGAFKEYFPDGPSEEYLVESMVDLLWRRRRMVRYGEIKMHKQLTAIRENNESHSDWIKLRDLAGSFEKLTSAEEVEKQLSLLEPRYRNTILRDWPLAKCGDPKTWGGTIAKGLATVKVLPPCIEGDEFIKVVDPDSIELDLIRLERIDAQIERVFKRLMQTKTTKQALYRLHPQVITVSSANNSEGGGRSVEHPI
jgi:hypothetical protein